MSKFVRVGGVMQTVQIDSLREFARRLDEQANGVSEDPSPDGRALRKNMAMAYLRLARDMTLIGFSEEGLAACRKAQLFDPENVDVDFFYLMRLEKLNRIDEAWAGMLAIENRHKAPYAICNKLYFLKGCLEYRRGNLDAARHLLETFIEQAPDATALVAQAYGLLGKILDRLGRYDRAMEAFSRSNTLVATTRVAREMLRKLDDAQSALETSIRWYGDRSALEPQEQYELPCPSPVLLVGFPRSGTTLLDQILNSHSMLVTLEEKPTLKGISDRFYGDEEKLLSLRQAGYRELSVCRQTYWTNVGSYLETNLENSVRVVDKLPLNIMHLDLYARLFPNIRIIVALRDPRDCILSNYFQTYRLTPEMAANLSLAGSAGYYSRVMSLYLLFRKMLPDNILEVHYEQVVRNFTGECARMLEFLGLEWEDSLEYYYKNARKRWIKTPSYDQVVQPLYDDSIGRWKNYADHLREVTPVLQPFVDAFGYAAEQ